MRRQENMNNTPIEISQENKRGSQSTQIAQQNNYYGMDYQNTKSLCLDLIKDELTIYRNEAEKIAKERDEQLLNLFFERLHNEKLEDATVSQEFKNPDMQYTYIEAQKSYIRLGTKELENILANLLVDRVKENQRTLLQIALNEAITVVPMLLPEQLDILALCFKMRYSKHLSVNSIPSFFDYLQNSIYPHVFATDNKDSLYQHLVYAKTGSIDIGETSLENIFSQTYGGLFLKGYLEDELQEYPAKYPKLFTKCLQNPDKLQINALSLDDLNTELNIINGLSSTDKTFFQEHFSKNIMSANEIKDYICNKESKYYSLFKLWNDSLLKHLTLTSIGIILGANRAKQLCNETFDLTIWI